MNLHEALSIKPGDVVALVGAGGKTTAAMRLADEIAAAGGQAIITTTTKVLEPIPRQGEALLLTDDEVELLSRAPALLASHPKLFVVARRLAEADPDFAASYPWPVQAHKVAGPPPEWIDRLARALPGATILVEADGAKHRLLKAPAAYEPVVPTSTTLLVPIADLEVLSKPLNDEYVHRAALAAALLTVDEGTAITEEMVVRLLAHPQGGLKGAPPQARVVPLLHQRRGITPTPQAEKVARLLLAHPSIGRVVVAALRAPKPVLGVFTPERVAAIILAAGTSTRMGRPKQLLPWDGKPMLQHVVDTVRAAPVDQVVLVLGHHAPQILDALDLSSQPPAPETRVVVNPDPARGLSSSVQVGLSALADDTEAALFVLADQPAITSEIITAIVQRYRQTRAPVVAPVHGGRRGNPVLFARETFPALMQVRDDQGGRAILAQYAARIEQVEVGTDAIFQDIDTVEDYLGATHFRSASHLEQGAFMKHSNYTATDLSKLREI
ncbi:MAG: putative selenium-dependent hydroxylase accessory protein YqeC, partial [Anaerolineae bacterium]|nr:putative selenium-dependent hydroxylase accessory protein YqeC [Anaerolineae bacterium]